MAQETLIFAAREHGIVMAIGSKAHKHQRPWAIQNAPYNSDQHTQQLALGEPSADVSHSHRLYRRVRIVAADRSCWGHDAVST